MLQQNSSLNLACSEVFTQLHKHGVKEKSSNKKNAYHQNKYETNKATCVTFSPKMPFLPKHSVYSKPSLLVNKDGTAAGAVSQSGISHASAPSAGKMLRRAVLS